MDRAISAPPLEAALTQLREEYRRAKADGVPPHRLRGLRIRLRTFLDEYRRVLPRAEAAGLRAIIEDVDHTLAGL
jgi:hypothetical protein